MEIQSTQINQLNILFTSSCSGMASLFNEWSCLNVFSSTTLCSSWSCMSVDHSIAYCMGAWDRAYTRACISKILYPQTCSLYNTCMY